MSDLTPQVNAGLTPQVNVRPDPAGLDPVKSIALPVALQATGLARLARDATCSAYAGASVFRTGRNRRARARPGARARGGHTRRRVRWAGWLEVGKSHSASARWQVVLEKAPRCLQQDAGAHSTPLERKAFHLLCRDRRSRSFLFSGGCTMDPYMLVRIHGCC
jgi:hypothetical protein